MIDAFYYRLNPMIDDDAYLDETDDSKLLNVMWDAKVYIYQNRDLFEEVARRLI